MREPARGTRRRSVLVSNSTTDGGVAAAAALRRAGWEVEGMDTRRLPLGIRSRHLNAHHVFPDAGSDSYRRSLAALLDERRPDVLLPIGFAATQAACTLTANGGTAASCNVPPLASFQAAHDKAACTAACKRLGIPLPGEFSREEAAALLRGGETACVVKPARSPGAARGVFYARDARELEAAYAAVKRDFGKVQIQEFIPGGPESMKALTVLFSPESRLVAAFTLRKIRQWPATGGVSVIAVSTAEYALVEQMLPLFEHWRWRGPAEVEFKQDPRDGRHKVIEINPRFPGYLRFPSVCGLDLPGLGAQLACEPRTVEAKSFPAYAVGRRFVNPGLFLRSVTTARGGAGWSALRELKNCSRHVASMLSDPLPAIARTIYDARHGSI